MTLIIILASIAIEQFFNLPDEFRRFDWFDKYVQWMENRLGQKTLWNGTGGVLITLAGPLSVLVIAGWILTKIFFPLGLLFALAVLLYSLGPTYIYRQLDDYIQALDEEDENRLAQCEEEFSQNGNESTSVQDMIENVLIQSNDRLFAVLFWFIILGPFGALMYRLTSCLDRRQRGIHGNYSESAHDLYNILNWPVARLLALGNALSGNMVDAVEAWREVEKGDLTGNETLIRASGLGALSYRPAEEDDQDAAGNDQHFWMVTLQSLLMRTLIIWLTVLGLLTLAGWLA